MKLPLKDLPKRDHLAIMKKSWGLVPKILDGTKIAESRWYKSKITPWNRIHPGDDIYFKDSGEPVTARAKVSKVLQYEIKDNEHALEVMKKHAKKDLGLKTIPNEITDYASDKNYAIFIFLENAHEIAPFKIDKTGYGLMSAWITVDDIDKIKKGNGSSHNEKYIIVSVVGPHAGESTKEIFARKTKEIKNTGLTFWLYKSHNAKPQDVQKLCRKALEGGCAPLCLFIEASSKGGAQATKSADVATKFSEDSNRWRKIPQGVLVTGSVRNSFALVFDQLEVVEKETILDLWDYSKFGFPSSAVQIRRGGSTVCCVRGSSKDDPSKLISNVRKVLAIGRLAHPFGIWLR